MNPLVNPLGKVLNEMYVSVRVRKNLKISNSFDPNK